MKKVLVAVLIVCVAMAGLFAADKVKIRWYVGLGGGTDEPTIKAQQDVVAAFNKSQNDIELSVEIVSNNQAYGALSTMISGGNAPDIVGPVGIRGRDSFKGAWLDLEPLVKKYKFDLSQFDNSMVNFYRSPGEGLLGIPFAIYPSFIYVNKELFKEAGLPIPPQKYGDPYIDEKGNKKVWNLDTMREIAMKLTVDENGNDATSAKFDPKKIVQFGYGEQWADLRASSTLFGPGSLVTAQGKAQVPANWVTAIKWYQKAMWKDYFYPNGAYGNTDLLGKGNWFESGKVAMVHTHLWYAGFANLKFDWDIAAVPAYNGKTTAKMHADTFVITRYSKNPDAAFKVLQYLLGEASPTLLKTYGGMPAKKSLQSNFLADFFKAKFPDRKITYQVVSDSIAYADSPNHESWMPSFQETTTRYSDFWDKMTNDPKFNVDAELPKFIADLDKIYKAAGGK